MKIIEIENHKPIFSWCPDVEKEALEQMIKLAKLPFVKHCALMPDAHQGVNMPIGGVIATQEVIIPDAVGVDIGCGMACFPTNLKLSDIKGKEEIIHHSIERSIPMGFSHNTNKRQKEMEQKYGEKINYYWEKYIKPIENSEIVTDINIKTFFEQMGTLGGGNHFIEMQYDEQNNIWIMVHSGSRNIGKKVCDYFNKIAQALNNMWYSSTTIPFLPTKSYEGKAYIAWMNMCLNFAFFNRMAMLDEIKRNMLHYFPNMSCGEIINIYHNYASLENHFGKNVWVHRKGATLASEKTTGIIPGSMGTASYIVQGLGESRSLKSCSHGSGRKMGRKIFNQQYNTPEKLKEIEESMKNIYYTKFGKAISHKGEDMGMLDVSEAPQAYKDIEEVINNEIDLIKPIHKLYPIINWKDNGKE